MGAYHTSVNPRDFPHKATVRRDAPRT